MVDGYGFWFRYVMGLVTVTRWFVVIVVLLHSLYADTLDFLIVVWDDGLCWRFDLLFV